MEEAEKTVEMFTPKSGEHTHTCDECARLISATYASIANIAQFIEDFDPAELMSKIELPSGPMGSILGSLLKR